MTDYSWLENEIAMVRWSTFHILKRNFTLRSLSTVGLTGDDLPEDYLGFLKRFGEARLFRVLSSGGHYLTVDAPKKLAVGTAVPMLYIGGYWLEGNAYFIQDESGVYTIYGNRPKQIGCDFESWLRKAFAKAKKHYTKAEWKLIQQPPKPFTSEEQRIVDAITRYRFKLVGPAPNGDAIIEVYNGSSESLNWVEVGIKAKKLEGAVQLDVHDIKPGETKVVARECYKDQVPATEIMLFNLPPPTPEDRDVFKELRLLNGRKW